jgi:glycine cleavage system H protein
MRFPDDRKYTKDHEWAKTSGNSVTIGITDHAQSALGDVVYVDLPAVGRILKAHETFGVVESIKAVSDLYSPISGKVTEVNEAAKADPGQLNRAPHGDAWLVRIEASNPSELDALMDAKAYEAFVQSVK